MILEYVSLPDIQGKEIEVGVNHFVLQPLPFSSVLRLNLLDIQYKMYVGMEELCEMYLGVLDKLNTQEGLS